jgi:hypothetical protein
MTVQCTKQSNDKYRVLSLYTDLAVTQCQIDMLITKKVMRTDCRWKCSTYRNISVLSSLRREGSSPWNFLPPPQDRRYNTQCSKCIK